MAIIHCTLPICNYATDDVSEALAIALLNNHGYAHTTGHPQATGPLRNVGPKLERPLVDAGISEETGTWVN